MNESPPHLTQQALGPVSAQPLSTDAKDLIRFESEKKSAGVALFLCWVFGIFGGHRFYLRRPHGVAMLIITLLSIPLSFVIIGLFGLVATWIWMIVDLFQVSSWTKEYNTTLLARIHS